MTIRANAPSAPLLSDPVQLVGDSRGSGHPAGGDPQPWGRAPIAGGHPARRSGSRDTRWLWPLRAAGGRGRALSRGPSRAPRPSGEGSQGCQIPPGTGALGTQGPRTTSLSPRGIRWGRISANPGSAEGRGGGERPGRRRGPPGGSWTRTPGPEWGEGWWGGGCEGHSQGQLPAAESSQLPACHRACGKWSVSVQKIEKEFSIRIVVWRDAEREEEFTNLSEQKGPLPSLA